MFSLVCPTYLVKLADSYKDLVNDRPSWNYYLGLKMLFCFFIHEYDSTASMIRNNSWTMSETHFFDVISGFDGNRFTRRMRASILKKYKGQLDPDKFILAFDDTDNPKYSRKLRGIQQWKSSKGFFFGQKILVLALVNIEDGFALPLDYRINVPKDLQKEGESAIDFAFEIVVEATKSFPGLPVVADSWFDSEDLARKFRAAGIVYVWEFKSNRNVKANCGVHVEWSKPESLFKPLSREQVSLRNTRWIASSPIYLNNKRTQLKAIAAYNRKNSSEAFAFYASNDVTISGARIWFLFRMRWKIECLFYDLKNHLNFGRLSSSNDKVNNLAIVIPFVLLVQLRIKPDSFGLETGLTISTMLETLKHRERERVLNQLINDPCTAKLEKLRIRRSRINKKPVVQASERIMAA